MCQRVNKLNYEQIIRILEETCIEKFCYLNTDQSNTFKD